jgi:hypothetical protein
MGFQMEAQKIFSLGDSLIMDPFSPGYCGFYMQTIFKGIPLKGLASSQNSMP